MLSGGSFLCRQRTSCGLWGSPSGSYPSAYQRGSPRGGRRGEFLGLYRSVPVTFSNGPGSRPHLCLHHIRRRGARSAAPADPAPRESFPGVDHQRAPDHFHRLDHVGVVPNDEVHSEEARCAAICICSGVGSKTYSLPQCMETITTSAFPRALLCQPQPSRGCRQTRNARCP